MPPAVGSAESYPLDHQGSSKRGIVTESTKGFFQFPFLLNGSVTVTLAISIAFFFFRKSNVFL